MKVHVISMLALAMIGQVATAKTYKGTDTKSRECYISIVNSEDGILVGNGLTKEVSLKRVSKKINNTYAVYQGNRVAMDVTIFPSHNLITAMNYKALGNPVLCTARLVAENN